MVVFLLITRCQAIFRHRTQTIRSTNDVGAEMTVHCKSKDDDLGSHVISVKSTYEFSFRPNFWGTTLFFCRFEWGSESHYFDIYISYRDHPLCNVCLWSIRPKGPCIWNYETHFYDICFQWNKDNLRSYAP